MYTQLMMLLIQLYEPVYGGTVYTQLMMLLFQLYGPVYGVTVYSLLFTADLFISFVIGIVTEPLKESSVNILDFVLFFVFSFKV